MTVFVLQVLSDFLDGSSPAANQTSEFGAKIDSWADLAIYTTIPLRGWWLWPDLVRRESLYLVVALTGYFLPIAFGFEIRGLRVIIRGSRFSLWLITVALLVLFLGGPGWRFIWPLGFYFLELWKKWS
jgi:CDP-diacylglycerol--glycerol-3-phosphate 3-phosphatidyltransferase